MFAEADDVGPGSCEHVLNVRFRQAAVAAVPQAVRVDRFGDGGFAARADGIAPLSVAGLLVFPHLRLDLLLGLGQQEDVASLAVDVAGAFQSVVAFPACLAGKEDGQPGVSVAQGGFPGRAGDPVRAGQGAGLPVDVEVLFREARPLGGLRVGADRTEQGDVPLLRCLVDAVWGDIAAVDDVLERLKALAGQPLMDVIEGSMSCCGAGRVTTWAMTCGLVSSQVSVWWSR